MQEKEYQINLDNYNGPLDLLLELVKDKKMDLFSIDLAELATDYLRLINEMEAKDIDIASEYLVMAATLLQIKARMLLENPKEEAKNEEDKNLLVQRLAEYQQFKQFSEILKEKEQERKKLHIKNHEEYRTFEKPIDETKLDGSSDPIKLIMALRKMFERTNAAKFRSGTISSINISPEERAEELRVLLDTKDELSFEEVFSVPTLKHFAVTLLAVLDMARLQEITLKQDEQFATIKIIKGGLDA
ncbi:segregation/condensation protein A [Mycoplasma todarodis]|uniref:Segregation and condensation protein A n=1 Tax=Mycoplasma todarodis TaxID=1937191 RepID=A0A4R0XTE3_9MOLU|nr:segregation/condensation protein A [Mycoplasma todarodis]TCG10899.1 segregation/condensation protein A [Mycoplasma todarodis]